MPIYLDYNATTPVDPAVLEEALPYLGTHFGNASSTHLKGVAAKQAMIKARERVARAIGATPEEIVFTSGGSESNNLVLKGIFLAQQQFCRGHLIISSFEHAAIREPARYLESLGVSLTLVPCSADGIIDPDSIRAAIRPDTRLVSIMHANNEIGTLQPIAAISAICREHRVLFHSDAAQSIGKVAANVDELGVDFLSIAGHKIYAPKGIGALYIRKGVELMPLIQGVGHEGGLRAGTENIPYIVALGAAMEKVHRQGDAKRKKMLRLRELLFSLLLDGIGVGLTQNGSNAPRLPNTLSLNFPNVTGVGLLAGCPDICASTSSACHSGKSNRTITQRAIGLSEEIARGTIRLSLGWHTSEEEIRQAAAQLIESWHNQD